MDSSLIGGGGAGAGGGADLIKDTTTNGFMADVIEASKEAVVLVDFWAPWCGPCKQLTPILEKVVTEANGKVRLVKLNIDEHPAIPGQMGIQSIPAVFAFKDGRPVDGFSGALQESQVKEFITRIAGADEADSTKDQIEAAKQMLEAGDAGTAAQIFATILQQDAGNADAIGGLAKCYVTAGELDRAEETLGLAGEGETSPAISEARAMLDLARKADDSGDLGALQAEVDRDGSNLQARFDLAIALSAAGDRERAVDQLMAIMAANRNWNEEAARQQLLQFFEAWGPTDPATVSGRQKLSSLLFA
jgi:putative thioredoxin